MGQMGDGLKSYLTFYGLTVQLPSTGETPFSLTYGAEAMIPTEVSLCSARVAVFNPV